MIPLGTEIVSGNYRYLPLQDLIFSFVSQRGRSSTMLEKAVLVKRFWEEKRATLTYLAPVLLTIFNQDTYLIYFMFLK